MRRPDVLGEPRARVVEVDVDVVAQRGRPAPRPAASRPRARARPGPAGAAPSSRRALEPRGRQAVVVVAGQEHDLGVRAAGPPPTAAAPGPRRARRPGRGRGAARGRRRAARGGRYAGRPRTSASSSAGSLRRTSAPARRAEVQVADDEGAHGGADGTVRATVDAPALHGLLVADFSRVLAGPLCTMTLADLGADVVKVERPGTGDDTRDVGPALDRRGLVVPPGAQPRQALGRARPQGPRPTCGWRAACARAPTSSSSRSGPATMGRLGLGHEALAAANPGVVTLSITAFGGDGPGRGPARLRPAAAGHGRAHVRHGTPDGEPLKVGAALIDLVCGLYATTGVLAALRARDRDGHGQHVEVSLLDSALASLLNQGSAYLTAGSSPGAWATAIPRSRRTRRCARPTAPSRSRSGTTRSSRGCARPSAGRHSPPTSASPRTPPAWRTATRWRPRSRSSSRARRPRPGWRA